MWIGHVLRLSLNLHGPSRDIDLDRSVSSIMFAPIDVPAAGIVGFPRLQDCVGTVGTIGWSHFVEILVLQDPTRKLCARISVAVIDSKSLGASVQRVAKKLG